MQKETLAKMAEEVKGERSAFLSGLKGCAKRQISSW